MKSYVLALFLAIVLLAESTPSDTLSSTNSYLTPADKTRFKEILKPGLKFEDASAAYYAMLGYKLIGESGFYTTDTCKRLQNIVGNGDGITPEVAFYVASTWKDIKVCQNGLPQAAITKTLISVIEKDTTSVSDLYYAIGALSALSHKLPDTTTAKVAKILQVILRKEDSLSNLGYIFHIAADLGSAGAFAFEHIEDAIVQADEVDGQYLQFEGGLSITSLIVNGIFKLSDSLQKKPPLTPQQIVKLSNYVLSRRSVQTAKGVTSLLSALTTLASNKYEKPICIALADGGMIVSNQQPLIKVKVCDVLGRSLPNVPKVVANSVSKTGGEAAVLTEKAFQQSAEDKTLFTSNLMEVKPERGFYQVSVAVDSITNVVTVKVLSDVTIEYLEIGTGDADQATQPKLSRAEFPNKLDRVIEADSQQKLVIRFLLKDVTSKKPVRVHQAFVRLASVSTVAANKQGHEIIFVAEPDSSNVYKFDMPIGPAAANFAHQSGDYNVELIVGDALLNNPFQWTIAVASLKFPEVGPTDVAAGGSKPQKQQFDIYSPKPEIKHMFREREKRPPAFVSNLFTGLCIAPVFLLLILWAKLGVNISNFPLSASAVLFHVGLGAIFVLFGVFWLKLNMFVTLRYLMGLGVVTFLAGNKLLSQIAYRRKLSSR